MQKSTFQDQLTTKDQSHSPPTAKIRLQDENSTTSPTSRTGCRRIQVKSMKSQKNTLKGSKYSISKRLIITIVKNRSNNLNFGQQKLKRIQPRYDDGNQSYQSPQTRRNEYLCIPSPLKIATTTTSCIDRYKTKSKQEIHHFFKL